MASSKEELEISGRSLCPICSEDYNVPRRIPTCGHTFCENCLFTFVFSLKTKDGLDTTFDCPVCGESHPLLDTGVVSFEWIIQTFPLVTDIAETDKGSCEAASEENAETRNCGPCAGDDAVIPGNMYCLECQAYLCDACVATHKKFKVFVSHKLLDRCESLDYENVLSDFHKYRKCPKHPDRDVELFCRDDEIFLCFMCASTSHKNCRNDVEASECDVTCKQKVEGLKKRIDKTQTHLNMLQQLLSQNKSSVTAKIETVVKRMTAIRNKIVGSVDESLEKVRQSTKQLIQDVEGKDSATAENVERLKALCDKKQRYLDAVNKYGSTPELFMSNEYLKIEIETLEEDVFTLDARFEIADVDLAFLDELNKISDQLEPSKLPNISSMNKASGHQPRYSLPLVKLSPYQVGKVDRHPVRFTTNCSPTFTGISIGDDGLLMLCDSCGNNSCGYLCLYSTHAKKKRTLKLHNHRSVTILDRQSIALTFPSDKQISIVSLASADLKVEKSLETKYQPKCIISLKGGKVAISWDGPPGFSIADISGATVQESQYFTQDSDGRKFLSFDYMAIDEPRKRVIQPCHKDKAVYCFDFTGKPVFKYTNNLKKPQGVAVDSREGSVYVCDMSDACIHQLTVRGQPITVIRHSELKNPLNVCYDKQRKCLWVSHYNPWDVVSCFERA